jgi:hypothetical protein
MVLIALPFVKINNMVIKKNFKPTVQKKHP